MLGGVSAPSVRELLARAEPLASSRRQRAVIVAVAAVRVVQVPADEVIDVIAVRHRVVAAALAVGVRLVVGAAGVRGRASGGVRAADLEGVLVDVVAVRVVQVPLVQIIGMARVRDGRVAAALAVNVIVLAVGLVVAHGLLVLS